VKYEPLGPDGAMPPVRGLVVFAYHAFLIAALIAASVIDAEHRIIPPQITYTALAVGVIGGALMPWPWPYPANVGTVPPPPGLNPNAPWSIEEFVGRVPFGAQPWPFWGPTFNFAPPGSWKLGLLNSVLGALAGSLVVRIVKWLFETGLGREALGMGDADVLMMAGAFFGWQIAVMALFVGSFAAIILYILAMALPPPAPQPGVPVAVAVGGARQPRELPFGPGLAVGVVATWLAWPRFGPRLQFPFFDSMMMMGLVIVMGTGLLAAALFLRKPAPVPAPAK
jgi:leader peptidase (prepilin peptidase) / N-methyltransferase